MIAVFNGNNHLERKEAMLAQIKSILGDRATDPAARDLIYADDRQYGAPISKVLQACGGMDLFGGDRVVVLKNADNLHLAELEELVSFLENAGDTQPLFIESKELFKARKNSKADAKVRKNLKKVLEDKYSLYQFSTIPDWKVPDWLCKRASLLGMQLGKDEAKLWTEVVGNDLEILDNELKKLNLFDPELKVIERKTIEAILSPSGEGNVFELCKYYGLRNREGFIQELSRLMRGGDTSLLIIAQLFRHTLKLLKIRGDLDTGLMDTTIAERLGIKPGFLRAQKLVDQARQRPRPNWEAILGYITELDYKKKTGVIRSGADFQLALMPLILDSRQ
jgi:DNA polymerase-3 subunit delta